MNRLSILVKEELRPSRKTLSYFLLIIGMLYIMYFSFTSDFLKVIVFVLTKPTVHISFYHTLITPVLTILAPILCLLVFYDIISGDIRENRIRMIITKVTRQEYILSKMLSGLIIVISTIFIAVLFLTLYTIIDMSKYLTSEILLELVSSSVNLLVSLSLVCVFASTIFLSISAFTRSPLFNSVFFLIISFMMANNSLLRDLSFFTHTHLKAIPYYNIIMLLSGTFVVFMATIFLFNRKRL